MIKSIGMQVVPSANFDLSNSGPYITAKYYDPTVLEYTFCCYIDSYILERQMLSQARYQTSTAQKACARSAGSQVRSVSFSTVRIPATVPISMIKPNIDSSGPGSQARIQEKNYLII